MTTKIGSVLAILTFFVAAGSLSGHHNYSAIFDGSKRVALTGTLTKLDWRNPHIEISLDAKNDRGQAEAWVIEGGPPSFFSRNKISKSDLEKHMGQTVMLEIYRARDGTLLGTLLKITFADGTTLESNPTA